MTHRGGRPLSTSMVVLFVLAIQGLTPDLHELASANAFKMLFPSASGANPSSGQDQLPPEICASAEPRPASCKASGHRYEFARTALHASHSVCGSLTDRRAASAASRHRSAAD